MLTDVQIRKAKPSEKPYRLPDGGGLHLFITAAGGKLWRMRYEVAGKEKLLSFGPYPDVTLAEARERRDESRRMLRQGIDPSMAKKKAKLLQARSAVATFEGIAREWHAQNEKSWTPTHAGDVIRSLERDVFPTIGATPIREIDAAGVLGLLRAIEARQAIETARRLRQRMSAVFVFAIASGRAEADPAAIVQNALAPLKKGRQPAVTDLEKAREVLRAADATPAHPATKLALRILALTAVRPGALITTPWAEFDAIEASDPLWRIPAERMKLRLHMKDDEARDHLAPMSRQAMEAIAELRRITGRGPLAFPNTRHSHRPMSGNAIGYLLNRAGYHHRHVPHGWRATFSTIMNERFPADRAVIDFMLAHVPGNKVEAAYNRSAHLARRKELAQIWADLLMVDQLPAEELFSRPRKSA